jgi:hypothetical protein
VPFHVRDPVIKGMELPLGPATIFEQEHIGVDIFEDVASTQVSGVLSLHSQLTSILTEPSWPCPPLQSSMGI